MERDAHYAAVGIATVALLAALAVFSIWLARLSFNEDYDIYDIVFYGPVRGLSEGGEVHFNGILFIEGLKDYVSAMLSRVRCAYELRSPESEEVMLFTCSWQLLW